MKLRVLLLYLICISGKTYQCECTWNCVPSMYKIQLCMSQESLRACSIPQLKCDISFINPYSLHLKVNSWNKETQTFSDVTTVFQGQALHISVSIRTVCWDNFTWSVLNVKTVGSVRNHKRAHTKFLIKITAWTTVVLKLHAVPCSSKTNCGELKKIHLWKESVLYVRYSKVLDRRAPVTSSHV